MAAAYLLAPELNMVQTSCRKIRYDTRRIAEAARPGTLNHRRAGLAETGHGVLVAYRCRSCDGWHLGHTYTTRADHD